MALFVPTEERFRGRYFNQEIVVLCARWYSSSDGTGSYKGSLIPGVLVRNVGEIKCGSERNCKEIRMLEAGAKTAFGHMALERRGNV
jgi:hypothetical protein